MKKSAQTKEDLRQPLTTWEDRRMVITINGDRHVGLPDEMEVLRRLDAAYNAYKLAEEGWGKNYWATIIARLNRLRKLS